MKKLIVLVLLLNVLFLKQDTNAQVTLNNVRTYNGTAGASDYYTAIISDNSNNVYATGFCSDGICAYIIIEKFNSSGLKLWSKTYRSQNNGYDASTSIALDSTGGIYVAGYSKGINTSYDFLLIKYNQQGDTLWSKRYNGTANGDDRAVKVAVDRTNSIVVAGNASETGQGVNMVLIKYDINGNQLWLKKYDGSNHYDDKVNDFTFDKNNNIYIASQTNSYNASGRFYVVKTIPSGDTVWTKTFGVNDGSANAIITDDSLNVYATGRLYRHQDSISFYTVKLNSSGNQIWAAPYFEGTLHRDNAYRISLDELGFVYIAGDLNSIIVNSIQTVSAGYAVIKYTNNGQKVWVYEFEKNAPSNSICQLKILNSNNIYLAYTKRFLNDNTTKSQCVKLNSNGDSVWVKTILGQYLFAGFNSFDIDKSGNLLFGSYAYVNYGIDAALMKFNPAGSILWENYYNSSGFSNDNAISIGKDIQNNIYVTGSNPMNYIFIKYNSSFTQQWAVSYSDGYTRDETYSYSVVDSLGNIYLTGLTKDSIGNKFTILLKYNTSGTLEWQRKYSINPSSPWGICIDKIGNIIIAGTNWDNYNHSALNLLKYSPSGNLLMTTSFNATNNANIWIYSVETDFDNNILVVGTANGGYLWKFTSAGNAIWQKYWYNGGSIFNQINKIKYDRKNNYFLCGYTGTTADYDYLTIKCDSSGNQKWIKTFNGAKGGEDIAEDIVIDTIGNTYVTGYSCNQPANWFRGIVTIKYDSIGNLIWLKDYHLSPVGEVYPGMITRDKYNNIYILSKYNFYQYSSIGYFLLKYNSNGDSIWSFNYTNPIAKNYGKAIQLIGEDKIYVTGQAYGINTGYDITTLELSQTSGIRKIESNIPLSFSLYQNYPNPFNQSSIIKFQCSIKSNVILKIYDITGREVQTIINDMLQPGTYEVTFDGSNLASGIYFYSLYIDNKLLDTKKLSLIK